MLHCLNNNYMLIRKHAIGFSNLIILILFIYVFFIPKEISTDFLGVFFFLIIGFWIAFNIYALLLYKFFTANEQHKIIIEIIFVLLLLLPFFILWYFTS